MTNDYPPKVGGIQNYLWELWRRLPADLAHVYTTPHPDAGAFDVGESYPIERAREPWLGPFPWLVSRIRHKADEVGAELVLLDPAVPLGRIGPWLDRPYGVVLHGAEVTIPARLPGVRPHLRRVLRGAQLVVSAGQYALDEANRCAGRELPAVVVPPGVDTNRIRPLSDEARLEARREFGVAEDALLLVSVSRLVPRKGMHRLVRAAGALQSEFAGLEVLIGGTGRERRRLESLIEECEAPIRLLGRVPDEQLAKLYGAADVMAMLCADRLGGWEQEGFGIVFLEAAAAGVPQVAGDSGGAREAVVDGVTGLVVSPSNLEGSIVALRSLLADAEARRSFGMAARDRAVAEFDYDILVRRLADALQAALEPQTGRNGAQG